MKNLAISLMSFLLAIDSFGISKYGDVSEGVDSTLVFAVNTDYTIAYFADSEGKILFKNQFPDYFDEVHAFSHGYAFVKLNGKWGCIDTEGNMWCPPTYDKLGEFENGRAIVESNKKKGCVNIFIEKIYYFNVSCPFIFLFNRMWKI